MNKKILGLLCIIFILLSGVFYLQSEESKNEYKDQNVVISEDNEAEEVTSEKADTSVDEIAVYICGAVSHPGVYYFKEGSRINDAVRAAGGFKKKAAKTEVNLAESLCDGQQILIPSKGHLKNETADGTVESSGENSSGLVNIMGGLFDCTVSLNIDIPLTGIFRSGECRMYDLTVIDQNTISSPVRLNFVFEWR